MLRLMGRIEKELGFVTDEQQRWIDELRARPDKAEDQHLIQFKKAVRIELAIANIVWELNEKEQSTTPEHAQEILSKRKLVRSVIFDRWTTLLNIGRPHNQVAANNLISDLELCTEGKFMVQQLLSTLELRSQSLKDLDADLQGAAYGKKHLGLT